MVKKQIIYDELAFWDEEIKEEFEAAYGEDEYDPVFESQEVFDELFNNENNNQLYVVCGISQHWDGSYHGHFEWVEDSLKSAILRANNSYDGYITVCEGAYGKLLIHINHHDGNNIFQVRELTKIGREMYNNYRDVESILNNKNATRNVKYNKKYRP